MAERETEALRGKKWPRATQHVGVGSSPGDGRDILSATIRGSSQVSRSHPRSCGFFTRPHHALMTGAQLLAVTHGLLQRPEHTRDGQDRRNWPWPWPRASFLLQLLPFLGPFPPLFLLPWGEEGWA